MLKRLIVAFAILALAVAFAGTVPTVGGNFRITLPQASVLQGNDLKPGDYRMTVTADKVTLAMGKVSVDAAAKVETVEKKFETTTIRYQEKNGKMVIAEIRIGGSKTKVLFSE